MKNGLPIILIIFGLAGTLITPFSTPTEFVLIVSFFACIASGILWIIANVKYKIPPSTK